MRKGFTLIELLAVIVILAIIALIATPIILGIINDAKEDSNKRSVENYAHAVELAVARYAAGNNGIIPFGEYEAYGKTLTNKDQTATPQTIEVDYKGEKITGTVIVLDEEGKEGQILLSEIKVNNSETLYNYTEAGGVEKQKEKEISEEKDLGVSWYFYNTMYSETQTGLIEDFFDDSNNDKKSDINSELNAYLSSVQFSIPTTEFTQTVPASGNINAVITHYDGREEEVIFTTEDNKLWKYTYLGAMFGEEQYTEEIEFRPYTKDACDDNYVMCQTNYDYHYFNFGSVWIPFAKITILGKTIEFPANKQLLAVTGDIASEKPGNMYNDIDKVSRVIVNLKNGEKKEYKRNQMYNANEYLGESDFYSSSNIPVLYTTEETESAFGLKAFIINVPCNDITSSVESIIVEEDGILIKYNITDQTQIMHGYTGS